MRKVISCVAVALSLAACSGMKQEPKPHVFFVEPADGATVSSPFTVKFGVAGMQVRPSGEPIPGTGHHHLLINLASQPTGEVIPSDEKHLHFGKGQTEAQVKLAPGEYTLTMQFADGLHKSYGPPMSQTIRVTVK
ncbi:MAG: DUF4399 domain-containing protein [Rhodocyclaceae bacterium]|nr:DUF4399 domain-containing protein [Rhodocyclaceae bacterium]